MLGALFLALAGCSPERAPRVISAELLDNRNPDGTAQADEGIRIALDRPLPPGFREDRIQIWCGPPRTRLLARVTARKAPPALDVKLLATPPPFRLQGIHGNGRQTPESPTGIGVSFGPPAPEEQWVDLQESRAFPTLIQAVWEDHPVANSTRGNLAVDQGDRIRLVFDGEVMLTSQPGEAPKDGAGAPREDALRVLVPDDVILASPEDRLDDGAVPSAFEAGSGPREVRIVLGSNPRLTVAGRHHAAPIRDSAGAQPFVASGLALNATAVQPSAKIADRRGWPGAVSRGAVDIEFSPDYFFFERRIDEPFPPPGGRTDASVTALGDGRAIVSGGRTRDGKAIGQALLYLPDAGPSIAAAGDLEPRYLHTASLLPGPDRIAGTPDDVVIFCGGTDGDRSLGSIEAAVLASPGPREGQRQEGISFEKFSEKLERPRMYHTATAIPPSLLLVDGGRYSAPTGAGGILSSAELLEIDSRAGRVAVRRRWEIHTLPRMRHSSTYLGRGSDGAHYVLHFGGFGILRTRDSESAPAQGPSAGERFNPDEGVVLASPVLVRIDAEGPEPKLEAIPLDFEYRYEMLRYDHRAAAVGFDPVAVQGAAPREVLIAGGSLHPPNFDADRPGRVLVEPPHRPEDAPRIARKPLGTEPAAALVFEFHPDAPARSTFRVVESPTGDRRVHFALVPLPHLGVLILGGENPQRPEDIYATGEIYLSGERRLAPLAVPLTSPRTRLGAYVVEGPAASSLFILGGAPPGSDESGFADIERLKIDWR